MDQRKLMDNANTITDMAKTQNTVYEIVSDMSTRQDTIEERLTSLEEKLTALQDQVNSLPDIVARCLQQCWDRAEQRRNYLHPDAAAVPTPPATALTQHRSLASSSHPWPPSPVLQPATRSIHPPPETATLTSTPVPQQLVQQNAPSQPTTVSRPPLPS